MELAEVKAELQESKNENLRLWSVIKTLEKNQSSLEDKHNELKAMLLASQGHEKAGSNHKIVQEPKEDLEVTCHWNFNFSGSRILSIAVLAEFFLDTRIWWLLTMKKKKLQLHLELARDPKSKLRYCS